MQGWGLVGGWLPSSIPAGSLVVHGGLKVLVLDCEVPDEGNDLLSLAAQVVVFLGVPSRFFVGCLELAKLLFLTKDRSL